MIAREGGAMNKLVMAFVLGLALVGANLTAAGGQGKSQAELRKAFVGTWRLVSITGGNNPAARGKPTGLIIYDAHGNMAAQIQPDRQRSTYTGTPTAEQLADRARGYTAYFGTYTIDEKAGIVTHHRQGQLDSGAVDFVRKFELTDGGNRIVLTPVGGTAPPINLTWERVR
jgi:hypothetical protein